MITYTASKLLVMKSHKKSPLPGLRSGNEIVESELSKPHSAPKHPFINSNQKGEGEMYVVNKYTNAYEQNELQVYLFAFKKAFSDSKRHHFKTVMIILFQE